MRAVRCLYCFYYRVIFAHRIMTSSGTNLPSRSVSDEQNDYADPLIHQPASPVEVFQQLRKEDEEDRRGKLKIFLGMCAGVGKTYAMLQEARERKNEGKNVVIAYLPADERAETQDVARELARAPLRATGEPNGETLEMDLDAVLRLKPDIAVVDNIAHRNALGSRHLRRIEDVQELLDNGVNVFTTLNVCNLESRVDTVRQITGVAVEDTVPDSVLEEADEIELIDIAPDELLKRLAEGKIIPLGDSEGVIHAANTSFRKEILMALREMALGIASERAHHELQDYLEERHIAEIWKTGERLLVAVGPSPYSKALVRWTRRLAYSMDAEWIAVSVETSKPMSEAARERLSENLSLARELGAEVISTVDDDLVAGILRVARQQNVSQIIVGKPFAEQPSLWKRIAAIVRGSSKTFIERLIEESGTIDIYAIRIEEEAPAKRKTFALEEFSRFRSSPKEYAVAVAIACAVAALASLLPQIVGYQSDGMLLLFTTLLLALYFGRGPVLAAGFVGGLLWNFLYIPPTWSFGVASTADGVMFGLYFVIALLTAILTNRIKTQERAVRYREERTAMLYSLAKDLASAGTKDDVLRKAAEHIASTFQAETAFFVQHDDELLDNVLHPASAVTLDAETQDKEYVNAAWVFANQKNAGRFTSTFPQSEFYFSPLSSQRQKFGVVGVRFHRRSSFPLDQKTLLENFISQISSALERETLVEEAQQKQTGEEIERLHTTMLNAISYDIRNPLAEISLAASGLADDDLADNPEARAKLAASLRKASERLNRLVENLLDITRIDADDIALRVENCDISDLIGVVMARLRRELADFVVRVDIPSDFPPVPMDFALMEQALVNIVQNAAQYASPEAPITMSVSRVSYTGKEKRIREQMRLVIAAGGPGLPSDALNKIFQKFYRVPGEAPKGSSLGLAVTKGIIEAHGGEITAENRTAGGLKFIITLPMPEASISNNRNDA